MGDGKGWRHLEDQVCAITVTPHALVQTTPASHRSAWIVSPWFDLLFLSNIGWLLLLIPGVATSTDTPLDFWQIYFLTLPHRWLTLILVLVDVDRREGLQWILVVVALIALVVVGGVWLGTGALTCLAMLDFVWNAWHFGSQHAGVLRMYSKKVGSGWPWLERWGVRAFVTYAAIRTAGWTTGWLEADVQSHRWLQVVDWTALLIPAILVGSACTSWSRAGVGKTAYLLSVCSLYSGIVVSLSLEWRAWIVPLATASALFHAVEYLAVVTHYAWRRRTIGSNGALRIMARNWLTLLVFYIVFVGALGAILDRTSNRFLEIWTGANLWMALVHYAYDGMIWKLRKPATAAALGVA